MKISIYLKHFIKDYFLAAGCLMSIVAILIGMNPDDLMASSLLWQIIIGALAFTFFKFAFVNKFELGKKAELINLIACGTMADIMVILWLFIFSTNRMLNTVQMIYFVVISLVVHVAVYGMMYMDGQKQAKELNDKLAALKKEMDDVN